MKMKSNFITLRERELDPESIGFSIENSVIKEIPSCQLVNGKPTGKDIPGWLVVKGISLNRMFKTNEFKLDKWYSVS